MNASNKASVPDAASSHMIIWAGAPRPPRSAPNTSSCGLYQHRHTSVNTFLNHLYKIRCSIQSYLFNIRLLTLGGLEALGFHLCLSLRHPLSVNTFLDLLQEYMYSTVLLLRSSVVSL